MAIKKNTAAPAAEEKETKAPAKAAAPKAVKQADSTKAVEAKPAPKADKAAAKQAPKAEAPSETKPVEAEVKAEKIGRKEIAALIREKVAATGAAISPKVAEIAVLAYEEAVQESLAAGKQIALPGFGNFVSVAKAEAIRPNPQKKGETITVPAHNAPKFKPGTKLKAAVNGGVEAAEGADGE